MDDLATHDRREALERQHTEDIARANAALAAAQDRSYWLDRWQIDLNALMRRRGASEMRAALRGARALYRFAYDARNRARAAVAQAPGGLARAKRAVEQERELARPIGGANPASRRALEAAGVELRPDDAWIRVQPGAHLEGLPGEGRVVLEADGVPAGSILSSCTPEWRVALYLQGETDLYLLERR
jgi:hypothetical protein